MSVVFWGLASAMIFAATFTVVLPFIRDRRPASRPLVAIVLLIPLFAFGLYSGIGSPDAVTARADHSYAGKGSAYPARTGSAGKALGSVASLVDGLADRLQTEPDDVGGWLLLARSYEHLGRHTDASTAYGRAKALGETDNQFEEALRLGVGPAGVSLLDSQIMVRGHLDLDSAARSLVVDSDTVFIFAKASQSQRMPIVALRKSVADLPLDFVLSDEQAMVSGTSLADFDKLFVTARISRSGLANDVLGGLEVDGQSISPSLDGVVKLTVRGSLPVIGSVEVPDE